MFKVNSLGVELIVIVADVSVTVPNVIVCVVVPSRVKVFDDYRIEIFINENPQPYQISSRYNPKDLEDIEVYAGLKDDIIKEELYVTLEPTLTGNAVIAFSEINKYLENPFLFNMPTFPGFIRAVEGNDIKVITCDDATDTIGVVLFNITEENKIYSRDGCVIMEAASERDLIRVADRLTLTILGVMKP